MSITIDDVRKAFSNEKKLLGITAEFSDVEFYLPQFSDKYLKRGYIGDFVMSDLTLSLRDGIFGIMQFMGQIVYPQGPATMQEHDFLSEAENKQLYLDHCLMVQMFRELNAAFHLRDVRKQVEIFNRVFLWMADYAKTREVETETKLAMGWQNKILEEKNANKRKYMHAG